MDGTLIRGGILPCLPAFRCPGRDMRRRRPGCALIRAARSLAILKDSGHHQLPRTEDTVKNSLKDALRSDLNGARRGRDRERTLVLSTALAEVRNREIEMGASLDDEGVRGVLARAVKQRLDAAAQMRSGGRPELAEREEAQATILRAYLPEELSADEVREMVREIVAGGAGHIGAVMSALMPRIRGRFEGGAASAIVREELSGG